MSLIPCTSTCVYQQDGVCMLDSAAAAGQPSLGGACIHFIPSSAKRLGLPHRYSEQESVEYREVSAVRPPHDTE